MSIKNDLINHIKKHGATDLSESLQFLITEVNKMINSLKLYIYFIVSMIIGVSYFSSSNIILLDPSIANIIMGLLVLLMIYSIYKLSILYEYRSTVMSYSIDFNIVMMSNMDESIKIVKLSYIVNIMLEELSRKTHTTIITLYTILRTHDSKHLNMVLK